MVRPGGSGRQRRVEAKKTTTLGIERRALGWTIGSRYPVDAHLHQFFDALDHSMASQETTPILLALPSLTPSLALEVIIVSQAQPRFR